MTPTNRDDRAGDAALLLAFFLSGAAALGYELLWTRLLGLALGSETIGLLATLAGFFGGMALGAALLHRRAETSPDPVRLFVRLELVAAGFALVSPFLLHALARLVPPLLGPLLGAGDTPAALLASLLVATLALLPGTLCLGATLAALARSTGASSPVDTTAQALAPPGPSKSASTSSRTSRPRSPTSPSTTTSAAASRATRASSELLPAPGPANTPTRCPSATVARASIARTPRGNGSRTLRRRSGSGGARSKGCVTTSPAMAPRPSRGAPVAPSTLPRTPSPQGNPRGAPSQRTASSRPTPEGSPRGMSTASASSKPTTSA